MNFNQQKALTQYNELATSTCTPTGGGASVCTYQYAQKISTTTTTGTTTLATSSQAYQLQQQLSLSNLSEFVQFSGYLVLFGLVIIFVSKIVKDFSR